MLPRVARSRACGATWRDAERHGTSFCEGGMWTAVRRPYTRPRSRSRGSVYGSPEDLARSVADRSNKYGVFRRNSPVTDAIDSPSSHRSAAAMRSDVLLVNLH